MWGYEDPLNAPGRMTSGRRTYLGNKLVKGVPNSGHLRGDKSDHVGASAAALRGYFGDDAKIGWHANHFDVNQPGYGKVPYYGKRGTTGLVNGVDTSAPKGPQPMIRPRKPQAKMAALQAPQFAGPDPLAPMPQAPTLETMTLTGQGDSGDPAAMPTFGAKGKGGIFGSGLTGWDLLGAIGDGLQAYSGREGTYAPAMQRRREMQFDRDKFNQELEAKRQAAMAKAAEPPQWLTDAQTFNRLPQEQRNMVTGYRDAMYPVMTDYVDEQGRSRQGVYSRSQGGMVGQRPSGPPPEAVADLKGAVASGDTNAIAEFEEVFGPGSARSHLGN